jgi:hypothetical protein
VSDSAWNQVPSVVRKSMTGVALQQAIDHAVSAAENGGFDGDESHVTRHAVALDDKGMREVTEALERLHGELDEIGARAAKRTGGEDEPSDRQVALVTMLFENAQQAAGA